MVPTLLDAGYEVRVKEKYLLLYEPHFKRAFIHVRDFASGFLFAIENADRMVNQVYNLGSESLNLSKGEPAQRIREKGDFVLETSDVGEDPDKRDYTVDFSKLYSLGYRTEVSIEEGIEELVRGFRSST